MLKLKLILFFWIFKIYQANLLKVSFPLICSLHVIQKWLVIKQTFLETEDNKPKQK